MNREEALARFVGESLRELTDPRCSKKSEKELRQRFAERHRLDAGNRFTSRDVAEEVVIRVTKARRDVATADLAHSFSEVPFINDNLGLENLIEIIDRHRLGGNSALSSEELSKVGRDEYLNKVERELQERARAAGQKQLEQEKAELEEQRRALAAERQSVEALKSSLEALPEDVDPETLVESLPTPDENGRSAVWWKELGLDANPFASNQGLSQIPAAKYDSIVVQTPFIKSYIERMENSPAELVGKTIIVLGEFGSGKTTLFQLLAHRAGQSRLIPVLAFLNPEPSLSRLMHQLISQIVETTRAYEPSAGREPAGDALVVRDEVGACARLMAQSAHEKGRPGHLIFIDGLHKSLAYQRESLEFLQHIQNFQERLSQLGVATGILVAGSPSWRRELESNPALSGSFYAVDEVPPLQEDDAVEAVIRRIQNFVPPTLEKPRIDRDRLRAAFRLLSTRLLRPPTFRDYLDHVRARLVSHEEEDLGISLAAHREAVDTVQSEIQKSQLGDAFAWLVDPGAHSAAFIRAISDLVPLIYSRRHISETDPKFLANKGAFHLLRRADFIAPRRLSKSNTLVWVLSDPLVSFLSGMQERYRLPPSEVLAALFNLPSPKGTGSAEAETIYSDVKARLEEMAASWRASWIEIAQLLDDVRARLARIEHSTQKVEGFVEPQTLNDIRLSTMNMARALLVVGSGTTRADVDVWNVIENSWYAPENLEAISAFGSATFTLPNDAPRGWGLLSQHAQVIDDLASVLSELVRGEGVCRLTARLLTAGDAAKLHRARMAFLGQRYDVTVDEMASAVDSKVKDLAYPILRCALGDRCRTVLPRDVSERLRAETRGHPRAQRDKDPNFFYDISRSDFPKIIFQRTLRDLLWAPEMTEEQYARLRDDSALLFSLEDRDAHRDRAKYFREKSTEIGTALQTAPRICEYLNETLEEILGGPHFSILSAGSGKLEVRFGPAERRFGSLQLDSEVAKAIGRELLLRAEACTLDLPPVDETCSQAYSDPEVFIAMLRLAENERFISPKLRNGSYGRSYSLTPVGAKRLQQTHPMEEPGTRAK